MASLRSIALRLTIVGGLLSPGAGAAQSEKTYEGEIADSQCSMNVHSLSRSHKEMIDMGAAGKTAADCTRYCVTQRGGRYVLQTKHDVFKLDRQDLVKDSAGLKVKVIGELDPKTNILQVHSVEPLPSK